MNDFAFTPVPFSRAQQKHRAATRIYQGIPSITSTAGGRLFAVWYGGDSGEGPDNYIMIVISDDGGESWSSEEWVVDPPQSDVRAFDSSLFTAPDGSVHCFWTQCRSSGIEDIFDGRSGVWHSRCENPDAPPAEFRWSYPERISDGIMMNRAVVLSDGTWALPVSIWRQSKGVKAVNKPEALMYVSEDEGKTFHYRGGVEVPAEFAVYDEHSLYELSDGTLGMFIRKIRGGYFESFSKDRGRTWSQVALSPLPGSNARGFLGRLASGNLLAVTNDAVNCRRNLTAFLSTDDGKTWDAKLRLDLRDKVSYPDVTQTPDGTLYIIYDHDRYDAGEILCTKLTEADILSGNLSSPGSFAAVPVSKLTVDHKQLLSNIKEKSDL